jgi:hypothetical protein
MTLSGRDVFLIGPYSPNAPALTAQLHRWGLRCHFAGNIRAASDLLSSRPFNLVLSNTHLPDGTVFGMLVVLADLPVTAFLCLPVENSCFWLPAIDDGKECPGLPALRPSEFAKTLEDMTRCLGSAPRAGKPVPNAGVA